MTEASNELLHELLRRVHQRFDKIEHADRERRAEIAYLRNQNHTINGDLNDMRRAMAHLEDRLDLIERRLELRDFQEMAQTPYDGQSN